MSALLVRFTDTEGHELWINNTAVRSVVGKEKHTVINCIGNQLTAHWVLEKTETTVRALAGLEQASHPFYTLPEVRGGSSTDYSYLWRDK